MHTTTSYSNRGTDANIMLRRLATYRHMTTDQALDTIEDLRVAKADAIRSYKDPREIDSELGDLILLVEDRKRWNECFDDCPHWAGDL